MPPHARPRFHKPQAMDTAAWRLPRPQAATAPAPSGGRPATAPAHRHWSSGTTSLRRAVPAPTSPRRTPDGRAGSATTTHPTVTSVRTAARRDGGRPRPRAVSHPAPHCARPVAPARRHTPARSHAAPPRRSPGHEAPIRQQAQRRIVGRRRRRRLRPAELARPHRQRAPQARNPDRGRKRSQPLRAAAGACSIGQTHSAGALDPERRPWRPVRTDRGSTVSATGIIPRSRGACLGPPPFRGRCGGGALTGAQGPPYQLRTWRDSVARHAGADLIHKPHMRGIVRAGLGAGRARDHPHFRGRCTGGVLTGHGVLPTDYAASAMPAAARRAATSARS